ncbi:MAG: toprim domain-containing protein [Trichodesmium sp. MAG_R04]|jgi:hypothetical protein|nr:toprim domain-containing protein [Trichodesmium sp. MAG_R04]
MRTQEAYAISILDCAYRLNLKFSRTYRNPEGFTEHIFHCPLRNDKNASIYINGTKNVWYDNGGISDGGGIIQFINYLNRNDLTDTSKALKLLDNIYPELKKVQKNIKQTLSSSKTNSRDNISPLAEGYNKKEKKNTFEVVQVKNLFLYPLKNYLKDNRKINLDIAKNYVKEIHYKHLKTNYTFYGIGFKSGSTWAIRRNGFKGFIGQGADISVIDNKSSHLLIFEGFIDFLSYLTIKNIKKTSYNILVLNSTNFINQAIKYVQNSTTITTIDYFKDNDLAGENSLKQLEISLKNIKISDKSSNYKEYKDLNNYLVNRKN